MRRAWLAIVLATAISAPLGSASWKGVGTLEPDFARDVADGFMFADPDQDFGQPALYFDAFVSVEQLTLNPNLGALGGRFLMPGAVHHRAVLGIWKDCNADGYIGLAEAAIQDYRATIIDANGICPAGSWFNDGEWVSEMVMIGAVDPCEHEDAQTRQNECGGIAEFHPNPRVIYANATMVWGDAGKPGEVPLAECVTTPLPAGSTTGTGALLGAFDCQTDRAVAKQVNTIDPDGALGLRFDDTEHPESSDSLLNQRFPMTLWGRPEEPGILEAQSGSSALTVWDCSDRKGTAAIENPLPVSDLPLADPSGGQLSGKQTTILGSFVFFADEDGNPATPGVLRVPLTDGQGSLVWVPGIAGSVNERGSAWDAAEAAVDGPRGDCDAASTSALRQANPERFAESERDQIDEARKDRTSLTFTFYDGHRGLNDNVDFALGDGTPSDAGLVYHRHDRGGDGPMWSADTVSTQEPQLVTRRGLQPDGHEHFTYYARIGEEAQSFLFRAPGGGGFYGRDVCTSGEQDAGGWVCDGERWWLDENGESVRPAWFDGTFYAPTIGTDYHLRDVDCYDGNLARGQPVYASLAQLDETGTC